MKEAIGDLSVGDDAILAMLQCCDYNVDETVAALLEGSASLN